MFVKVTVDSFENPALDIKVLQQSAFKKVVKSGLHRYKSVKQQFIQNYFNKFTSK